MFNKTLQNHLMWAVIFLATASLGLYVRFYPLRADIWSDNKEKATALVIAKIRMAIAQQTLAQYPDMPDAERNSLIETKFAQTLHDDSAKVKRAILEVSKGVNAQAPEPDRRIYLQEADGYYYYDLTQNILETGRLSGERKGSKFLNERMAAPFGFWQPVNLHPYVGAFLYKTLSAVRPGISVMDALCYSGPVLSLIALAAFLWCCRCLSVGPLAASIGAVYFYLAPIFVKRSTFAWNDDDSYNVLFPLLIFALVFKAIAKISTAKDSLLYGIGAAVLICVYSLFWHGWGFTFALIGVGGLLMAAVQWYWDRTSNLSQRSKPKTIDHPDNKTLATFLGAVLIATPILMSIIFGPADFIKLLEEGFSGLQKLTVNQISVWPNLFVAVGELSRASVSDIIGMTGNLFWWGCVAAGSIGGSIVYGRRKDRVRIFQLILLIVALAATLKITLNAQRFILLCVMPVALLGTIGVDLVVQFFRRLVHTQTLTPGQPKAGEIVAGLILLIGAVVFPIKSINAEIAELLNPIFNVTWEKALLDIRDKTPLDSIVTSWWPPGHFIKAVARRRVTFDGATITSNKEAYWVANVYLTSDERKAAGILRMLNTSGTQSMDFLTAQGMKVSDAVSLLHFILAKNRTDALEFLKRVMPPENAEHLIRLTHGESVPPSYLLLYTELMEKSIGLQFVGKWNFHQMEEINNDPQRMKSLPPANSPRFFEFLWTTIGGAYHYSEALISIAQSGSVVDFTQGIKIDLASMDVAIASPKFGTGVPQSIIYPDGDNVVEKKLRNATLNYSVVFFKENSRYYCRLMDQELAQSVLTKMYFFKGKGLTLLKPFSIQSSMTGRDEIFVFELDRDKL